MRWLISSLLAMSCAVQSSTDAGDECCRINGALMEMSWGCYCSTYGCGAKPSDTCSARTERSFGCGYRRETNGIGLSDETLMFDDAGVLVGYEITLDADELHCSSPGASASSVRAGIFPACAWETTCDCVDGGVVCP